jgi:hypothetical protein
VDTVKIIDTLLRVETPTGPSWHRYNDDGYGEHLDGAPFDGTPGRKASRWVWAAPREGGVDGGLFVGFFGIGVELVGDEEVVEAGLEHERGGIFL